MAVCVYVGWKCRPSIMYMHREYRCSIVCRRVYKDDVALAVCGEGT